MSIPPTVVATLLQITVSDRFRRLLAFARVLDDFLCACEDGIA